MGRAMETAIGTAAVEEANTSVLLIVLFLLLAGGAGVLGGVLHISAWMLVPFVLAAIVIWFLAHTGRKEVSNE